MPFGTWHCVAGWMVPNIPSNFWEPLIQQNSIISWKISILSNTTLATTNLTINYLFCCHILYCYKASILWCYGTPEVGHTSYMLWCILQHSVQREKFQVTLQKCVTINTCSVQSWYSTLDYNRIYLASDNPTLLRVWHLKKVVQSPEVLPSVISGARNYYVISL